MNKPFSVVVTSCAFSKNEVLVANIKTVFPNTSFNVEGKRYSHFELLDILKSCDMAIVGLDKINEEVLEKCPNLKYISKFGVGIDNIDLEACRKRNVKVLWKPGINKTSVAELTLGFILGLIRNIFKTSYQLKEGVWDKSGGCNLREKTVGIIGVGNVGKELIKLLKPFNCKILVNDIIDQKEYYLENNLEEVSKKEIFEQSDIISLHVPLTDKTKNLINLNTFSMMKPTGYLVNTSRGLVVNEGDLFEVLKSGGLAGAALDVYHSEPPTNKELIRLKNLICTPHIGGNSQEATLAMGFSSINLLRDALEHEP